ncbi:hypothetical protein BWQ96_06626 [Gracilariopsis chorda]|uniref:Uncharacterized protein n=1 Tax=Gracilariopsis chorda TaxID=448386 RepID=A0A2V3INI5_9FLOR|nr:hypothetical protein BWQ96_06626 [Gracilariopsis chorda]|eukprot:PXF43617.1 hypothetical protein BWQ96_06626 [Gracilariopsis chorda]
MVSSFRIRVELDIRRDILWKVRATSAYMRFLRANGAIKRMESIDYRETGETTTSKSRTLLYVPANVNIPEMIAALIDDCYIEIRDTHTWDDAEPYVQYFTVRPNILQEVISTTGCLTMEEDMDDKTRCVHTLWGECNANIPLLGYYVEQAIISNMEAFYDTYNTHVKGFVKMIVNEFGDGTLASLDEAVERLLRDERPQ